MIFINRLVEKFARALYFEIKYVSLTKRKDQPHRQTTYIYITTKSRQFPKSQCIHQERPKKPLAYPDAVVTIYYSL